ncbi:MAG: dihydroneopterin aldolase [Salibacteraceae bacterium]
MDELCINGLRFRAFHGCHPLETERGGEFEVDIKLRADLSRSAESDKLADTIDYVEVMTTVKKVMETRKNLIESLAYSLARALKNRFPEVSSVEITLTKHDVPVSFRLDSVSTRVTLE